MLTEKSFNTGELQLNYAEGPASGPPLVLLHGLTSWRHAWEPCLPQLTPAWHVYAVDLRGHGESDRAGDHYLLSDYARDMAAFLKQRVIEPAVLMGHSLGALTALATAPLVPESVRALVLVDPPLAACHAGLDILPAAKDWFGWVHETVQCGPSFDEVVERCRRRAPELDADDLVAMAQNVCRVAPGTVVVALHEQMLEGLNFAHLVQQVGCPVLLMRGDWNNDSPIRDEDAAWFQAQAPHAQVVQIPQGTHSFLWEQPELSFAHVHAFLANTRTSHKRDEQGPRG